MTKQKPQKEKETAQIHLPLPSVLFAARSKRRNYTGRARKPKQERSAETTKEIENSRNCSDQRRILKVLWSNQLQGQNSSTNFLSLLWFPWSFLFGFWCSSCVVSPLPSRRKQHWRKRKLDLRSVFFLLRFLHCHCRIVFLIPQYWLKCVLTFPTAVCMTSDLTDLVGFPNPSIFQITWAQHSYFLTIAVSNSFSTSLTNLSLSTTNFLTSISNTLHPNKRNPLPRE